MGHAQPAITDRRTATGAKLVVVDLESVFEDWLGPVPASELLVRSVLIRTLAEARREHDVYLIGCSLELGWVARDIFPNSAVFIESDEPGVENDLSGQFLDYEKTGGFSELVVVSTDQRFLEVAELFKADGRSVRVLTDRASGETVLNGEADLTLYLPSFELI